METILNNSMLEYNPDTLQYIREQYGFDQLRINESIDILEEWLKKQEHFVKKIFPRDYLERIIVHNKGSVEKSKRKLDKLFTLRSLLPEYFEDYKAREIYSFSRDVCEDYILPKTTPDYSRVVLMKVNNKYNSHKVNKHLIFFLLVSEYLQTYDYCNGLHIIGDWREGNAIDYGLTINISDFRKILDIVFEGHSMKINSIHLMSGSKTIDTFATLLKKSLSPKLGDRIQVHKSIETIYKCIPKDILPVEYGGNEKPLAELREKVLDALDSEEFKKCRQDINEGRTNEAFRSKDIFNEYMGMSGTFRNLSVD